MSKIPPEYIFGLNLFLSFALLLFLLVGTLSRLVMGKSKIWGAICGIVLGLVAGFGWIALIIGGTAMTDAGFIGILPIFFAFLGLRYGIQSYEKPYIQQPIYTTLWIILVIFILLKFTVFDF